MRSFIITAILALNSLLAFGQNALDIGPQFHKLQLTEYLSFYADEEATLDVSTVSSDSYDQYFKPSEGKVLRFGVTSSNIWLKLPVTNNSNLDKEFIILFEDPSLFRIEQYIFGADGSLQQAISGTSIRSRDKPFPGNQNSFPVSINSGERVEIVYKIESRNFISLPLTANSYSNYHRESINQRTGQGIYYGALLIILFYALLAYFGTRNVTFIYYFISIIFFGLITGTYDGTTPQFLHSLVILSGGYYDILLSAMSNIFGLLFMISFLEIKPVAPRYYKATRLLIALMLGILVVSFFSPSFGLQVISAFSVPFIVFVLIGGVIAVRENVSKGWYFLWAYGTLTIAVLVAILSLFDVLPISIYTKYILHIGFLISLFILSLGLGKRINQIRLDLKEKEVEQEIAEKKIIEQKNKELEQKVIERTKDIIYKEINLRSIIDNNLDDAIWLIDRKFRLIDFNEFFKESFKSIFGITLDRNKNLLDALPEKIRDVWKERYERSLAGESAEYLEEYDLFDMHLIFQVKMYPIKDNEKVTGVSVYSKNITEMKKVEEELRNNNESLIKVNEELDRFVYSASHDLKAPLSSVLGLINITKKEKDKKSKAHYLDLMEESVGKLNTFIKDIENYSRNVRTEVINEEIDLEKCIEGIIEGLYYIDGVNKVDIAVKVMKGEKFFSDKNRVNIILSNLINNALRYSIELNGPEKTRIDIQATAEKERALVSICDNGPGISEEYHEKIYEMFYRVHNSISGTGLGLYIVKEAIKRLKGEVRVKSEINNGATFIVDIPNGKSESPSTQIEHPI